MHASVDVRIDGGVPTDAAADVVPLMRERVAGVIFETESKERGLESSGSLRSGRHARKSTVTNTHAQAQQQQQQQQQQQ